MHKPKVQGNMTYERIKERGACWGSRIREEKKVGIGRSMLCVSCKGHNMGLKMEENKSSP